MHMSDAKPILLVEDSEVDIENITRFFKKKNIEKLLYVARDGVEALDILYGRTGHEKMPIPKFIFLDINMPRMNGIDFLKEIRKDSTFNKVLVFVLTSSQNEKDILLSHDLNIAGYLVKSTDLSDLVEVIEHLLNYINTIQLPQQ